MNPEPDLRPGRIPTLDGLRALSLALVFLAHQFLSSPTMYAVGQLGVRVFFVISGYIITRLLLAEHARSGTISLRSFYFRRTWRIFPPCYAYIAATFLLSQLGLVSPIPSRDYLVALTYTSNYVAQINPKFLHLWSLSVEEQFYLLWPLIFTFAGTRSRLRILLAVLLVVPLLRLLTLLGYLPQFQMGWTFHTVADALGTGCLVAMIPERSRLHSWIERVPHQLVGIQFVLVPAFAIAWEVFLPGSAPFLAPTLANLSIAFFVARETRASSPGLAFRILNLKPIVQVGLWSYSLYLWQQPFLLPSSTFRIYTVFPLNYGFVFMMGLGSYYLIEQPSMRLRKRLETSRTASAESRASVG